MTTTSTKLSLGRIISWKSPPAVGIGQLRTALSSAGFNPNEARDLLPANAFRRAAKQLEEGRIIKQTKDEGGVLYFQFLEEQFDGSEFHYSTELVLSLDKDSGKVRCDMSPEMEAAAQKMLDDEVGMRHSADITRLVQKLVSNYGGDLIPIRPQGGAYFVPESHSGIVTKLEKLLLSISGDLLQFAVSAGDSSSKISTGEIVSRHVQELIEEAKQSCEGIEGAPEYVKARRIQDFSRIRVKMNCYRDVLAGYTDKLGETLHEAESGLYGALGIETPKQITEPPSDDPAVNFLRTLQAAR